MNKKVKNDYCNSCRFSCGLFSMLNACVFYLSLICNLLTVSVNAQAAEKEYSEAKIKSAYIYNFLRFTKWPSDVSKASDVCVYGHMNDYAAAFSAMATIRKAGKPLDIKFVNINNKLQELNKCQIIFITSAAVSKTSTILAYTKNSHSLTVGESDQFLEQGGMVNFIRKGNKIRFEINVNAYELAELKISSKVLRIAERLIKVNDNE